ncbi:Tetratricopeptide repeat protein [Aphelenchoides fujianensis]|nr:Tetratricopeptide repeat protein [Aphelenchoides fujianensis]
MGDPCVRSPWASRLTQLAFVCLLVRSASADKKQEVQLQMERGNQALSKGQFADALQHYHAAVELDPTDYQIFFRRATVLLATGKMKAAIPDLDKVVELKPDFIAGRIQRGNILLKQGKFADAKGGLPDCAQELEDLIESADEHLAYEDYATAESLLDKIIEECMWDPDLHRKRAKCRKARGDIQNAISDIRAIAKLVPDATDTYLDAAEMYYEVGDVENSLGQVRECLKLNPDHKKCFPFYKRDILKFEQNVESVQLDVFRYTCRCNKEAGHIAEAIQECTEVLKYGDPNDLDVLCDRAEAYILNEQFEKGISWASGGMRTSGRSTRHEEEKKRAQEKFIDIAAAKEVLSDPEKREQFDNGHDPLDPSAQQAHQQGWQHFHQGGFPNFRGFGGGGEQFTFKFTNF